MGGPITALGVLTIIGLISPVMAAGDIDKGRDLADELCKGCHVVGIENRHGGIDSTPSFFLMHEKLDNYRQRLWTLKKRPPHIAYDRLDKVSTGDIEHLIAYITKLKRPK